ncbi:MAG: tRNA (adenosine(37)-N6)-dimethylallyltransferase MiaA [Chitinophagales bacterium]|nr:tRNA (adenosine(37)-N6)-dimethylallyltransferase MiaA [Chitinophagales bacterium]
MKFLIAVAGPTAIGKTKVSIALARYYNSEIISADARQLYREMNIGTAKPLHNELNSITHHFINHCSIHQAYSAGDFEKEALLKINYLFESHDVLVITGGSGLFMRAVLQGLNEFPSVNKQVQHRLDDILKSQGIIALQNLLRDYDPKYYESADLNNPRRLLRALSVSISSGKPYSSFKTNDVQPRNFQVIKIGLYLDRNILYHRINNRVDQMMQDGFLQEAQNLKPFAHLNALQTVGYQELFDHLDGKLTLPEAVNLIKQHSRNYAKRQLTWLRKEKDITWFHPDQIQEMIVFVEESRLKGKIIEGSMTH